ncbi:MAG TPA: ABC transporter ATP-binding protein [Paludibaculum sp.]|jgi:ABC-2 type transport system ATP-binding protein
MLEVLGLTKRYQRRAVVDVVNFRVAPGEVLGYLGPNGSGKSTTVKMITGLLEPSEGVVLYHGRNIRDDLKAFQRILGYVPEEPFVYPYLTGREYLQLTGRLRSMPESLLSEKIDSLLNLFSLYEHRFSPISSYSKGMKQKILITAALLHDPQVVIFDEPLSGLDVTTAMVFKSLVHALSRRGKVILYSSHVLEVVEKVCTRVLILRQGRVVAHDSVAHLRTLLQSPSLEDVFSQLVVQEDTEKIAEEMAAVIGG